MSKILNPFKFSSIHYQSLPHICYISSFRNHETDKIIHYQYELCDTGMDFHVDCHLNKSLQLMQELGNVANICCHTVASL
jgi:hypothetical protein